MRDLNEETESHPSSIRARVEPRFARNNTLHSVAIVIDMCALLSGGECI